MEKARNARIKIFFILCFMLIYIIYQNGGGSEKSTTLVALFLYPFILLDFSHELETVFKVFENYVCD